MRHCESGSALDIPLKSTTGAVLPSKTTITATAATPAIHRFSVPLLSA